MKVYITGSGGYMGTHFVNYLNSMNVEIVESRVDITDYEAISKDIATHSPTHLINCAGKTGRPNVDWCEVHQIETLQVNVYGALNLMQICLENNIHMTHLGSGCVYSGDESAEYSENDKPNFTGSYYSKTKALSESIMIDYEVLQLRIRMPIEGRPEPRNLITKLLKYKQVIDMPNSATVIEDFLPAAWNLIEKNKCGIYNMTNPGYFTHSQILELYKEHIDADHGYEVIDIGNLDTKAPRSNCVLNTDKLDRENVTMPPIAERLEDIIKQYKTKL